MSADPTGTVPLNTASAKWRERAAEAALVPLPIRVAPDKVPAAKTDRRLSDLSIATATVGPPDFAPPPAAV